MKKAILLTFDVEEFDLPKEYSINLSEEQEFEISRQGLTILTNLLNKYSIKATFFATATFAKKYPQIIKNLQNQEHEIACHGYEHCDDYSCNLEKINQAKKQIEKIIKTNINGFRAPRWAIKNIKELYNFDFEYDSSFHPIFLPGRYFNISKKRGIHKIGNIIEIPLSTLPPNFSIFWLAFKNLPLLYSKAFTKINFTCSNYTMLLFHPWEFTNLSKFRIPRYIKKNPKQKLEKYIIFCKKNNYEFQTISNYLQKSIKCPKTALTPRKLNFKSSILLTDLNLAKT